MEDGGRVTTVGREAEIDEGGGSWKREKRREKPHQKRWKAVTKEGAGTKIGRE